MQNNLELFFFKPSFQENDWWFAANLVKTASHERQNLDFYFIKEVKNAFLQILVK